MEVTVDRPGLIPSVVHERLFESLNGALVIKALREGLQQGQVGCPLHVKHPSRLFSLDVLVVPNFLECFQDLAPAVVNPVRLSDEGHNHILACRLREQHLGVTGGDDLASGVSGDFGKQTVDLALAKDLQVCVRLVQKQDRARVCVHVG